MWTTIIAEQYFTRNFREFFWPSLFCSVLHQFDGNSISSIRFVTVRSVQEHMLRSPLNHYLIIIYYKQFICAQYYLFIYLSANRWAIGLVSIPLLQQPVTLIKLSFIRLQCSLSNQSNQFLMDKIKSCSALFSFDMPFHSICIKIDTVSCRL